MPEVYQLTVGGVSPAGNYFENVLHFRCSESGSYDPFTWAEDLLGAFDTACMNLYTGVMGSDVVVNVLRGRRITSTGGPTALKPTAAGGGWASAMGMIGGAVNIKMISMAPTNKPGHLYLCGIPDSQVVGDVLQAAYVTAIRTLNVALLTTLTGVTTASTYDLCQFVRGTSTSYIIKHMLVDPVISYFNQRKRPLT